MTLGTVLFVQQAFRLIRSLAANTNIVLFRFFLRSIASAGSSLNKALKFRTPLRRFVEEFIRLKRKKKRLCDNDFCDFVF